MANTKSALKRIGTSQKRHERNVAVKSAARTYVKKARSSIAGNPAESEADVIAAVNFGRENNLLVSIRGGGHNAGGLGICDNGLVIDLSLIRYTHVDPQAGTVRVGGGSTWGEVDHATHAFGLAVPSGIISTTGVGGLTLGGGIGYLTRKCGLSIDNLIAADVVLADGRLVTADEQHNEDLFWALRGGGGNFGVITSFLFRLQQIDTVYAGPMLWPNEKVAELLRWYREFITSAPEERRASRSERLTGWVRVRKRSNGIDFFMCGPRSLRIRMWIGFWPPSKRARRLAPDRDPHPF